MRNASHVSHSHDGYNVSAFPEGAFGSKYEFMIPYDGPARDSSKFVSSFASSRGASIIT